MKISCWCTRPSTCTSSVPGLCRRAKNGNWKPDTPWSLLEAYWLCVGGTIVAADCALRDGAAFNISGGFHHAFPDHGEGFNLIHDAAVAIRRMQRDGAIKTAMAVDCDVHHGNGSRIIRTSVLRSESAVMHGSAGKSAITVCQLQHASRPFPTIMSARARSVHRRSGHKYHVGAASSMRESRSAFPHHKWAAVAPLDQLFAMSPPWGAVAVASSCAWVSRFLS